ncbi:Lhr-like helicase [Thermoplasmatales archaeon BRNA1]|nr:Lhr-like helicase [Thermoplasmatales archaeon BRNA1]
MEKIDKVHTMDEVLSEMEPLVSAWFRERFTSLTEPQSMAIPVIHQRKNVLISSPTGSGKTLTAFTSILNQLIKYSTDGVLEEKIYCIYISPLKALANDVNRNLTVPLEQMKELAAREGMHVPEIRVAVRSGDTPQSERQKMVRHPPHILITTPESMALILASPKFRENMKSIEWVILDEIHDICDSKRGAFLSLTMEMLRDYVAHDFTRIGLSATMAPIEEIAKYLVGFEPDGSDRPCVLIQSSSKKVLDLEVICPTEDMTALPTDVVSSMMYDRLKELVDEHDTTLVFTNTRSGAEAVVYKLKERGLENIEVHHSSLGRETRLDVEERLKKGEIKCVVSSTSLELGIDIGSVDLVCQIGSPKSVAKGLQRIGRSGHSFGKIAKGRLIVFDPDDLSECAVMCRAAHRSDIDRVQIPENPLDVLSQAVVGMSIDSRWDVDAAYTVVRQSYCFHNLPYDRFVNVLRYLGSKEEHEGVYSKIWYDEDARQFGKKKGARMIYFMNLGTIPEESNYKVITSYGSVAGELSEKFVERLSPGDVFVLGGRSLEFVRSKGMTAFVKEANGRKPTVPSWAGEMLPRSFDLSMDVARFRTEMSEIIDSASDNKIEYLCKEFDIDRGSARSLISYFSEQKAVAGFVPDARRLAVEEYIDPSGNQRLIFHFPFGRRVNDALSRAYAYRITALTGANASVTITDDNFMIGTTHKIDIDQVPGMLNPRDLDSVLRKAVKDSEIFKLRFRHTAARSFMILRNYMGRSISVNRQQVRSTYLLDMLRDMENEPVIEETYREILEDDMDIRNAKYVLELIENGKMGVRTIHFSGTPSPFAHTIILTGFSDIVLMEDRTALLKELHRKVLERALGDNIRDFEFEPDAVTQYFNTKVGRISSKEDIPRLLMKTGPLQAFRERGRNIYPYCDPDRKTVDAWIRELIRDGELGTVFLDDPHIMVASEVPVYARATVRERTLNEADQEVYGLITENTLLSDVHSKVDMTEDIVFRSVRKLESMYLITRTGITENNRWYYTRCDPPKGDRATAIDEVLARHLGGYGPTTAQEAAFALSIPDEEVRSSLDSMVAGGEVARGQFVVADGEQYMLTSDRLKLRSGKSNVYDVETVENYRLRKGEHFDSIEDYFRFYVTAGSEIDVFTRVEGFRLSDWQRMRAEGRILLGRFARGRVRFMLAEDADKYAYFRTDTTQPGDELIMDLIRNSDSGITMREIVAETHKEKEQVKEAVMRLDRSMKVMRAFGEREDWGTENIYVPFVPRQLDSDPTDEVVAQAIRAYGPIPVMAMRFLVSVPEERIAQAAQRCGAVQILVGPGQMPMWIMQDEVGDLNSAEAPEEKTRILSPFDPDLGSKWAELSSRYGDKWVYPVCRGSRVIGAVELWEMSGCIEIRAMDLDLPEYLDDALKAIDFLMLFFRQKGTDIVRIREILNTDAASLNPEMVGSLKSAGYEYVNGFYAKGVFVSKTMTRDEALSMVFRKQRLEKTTRYATVRELLAQRGYLRSDQEMVCRVMSPTTVKKQLEKGNVLKGNLLPEYVGYTTMSNMSIFRAAKYRKPSEAEREIEKIVKERMPVSKKEIQFRSKHTYDTTADAISSLMKRAVICQDEDNYYKWVPDNGMTRDEALREVAKLHFRDMGLFSAENMSSFLGARMAETRRVLSDLEEEGFLVKGFFIEGDSTLYWMMKDDVDKRVRQFTGLFLLNTQDNLSLYLRDDIKAEVGSTASVVFSGTKIIGSFKGRITPTDAKVDDFKGSDLARKFISDTARSYGVAITTKVVIEDEDWETSDFYSRMNPGI